MALSELTGILEDFENYHRTEGNSTKAEFDDYSSNQIQSGVEHIKRAPRKRIRKVGSVPYSTDLQRRRRMELLFLRSEVHALECQLTQLQLNYIGEAKPSCRPQPRQETWRNIAIIAYKERCCAENTNQELKKTLSKRVNMLATIQKLLWGKEVLEVRTTCSCGPFLIVTCVTFGRILRA
ncbi:hypothetical protein PHMEG_00031330 [Phytophthora megakarya]|uniref:Uncharacterized protein n=1 Tax=Phytophthora megakarya TaxID=4795 RepID=A0A225UY85_9STRA|nr:hypothetical protein PHMEG_00031330 [Phytophthora megakarya]